jgi:26S proteasome regulatory subunit N2
MASPMFLPLVPPSSSAAGMISYLEEDNTQLKVRALEKIYQIVDLHWAEICDSLPLIEELSEDTTFPAADLAAAVASKCFFHLQEYNEALRLALCAGKYFDISAKNEYIETILSKCIDEYKSLRLQLESDPSVTIDPKMENVMEQMFQRCYKDHCFDQAIGVALDTRRLDKVKEVVRTAIISKHEEILGYTFNLCKSARNITPREFRLSVIEVLIENYHSALSTPDYTNVCFGYQFLNKPKEVADTLDMLLRSGDVKDTLLAYQIALDLQEAENQGFVLKIVSNFTAFTEATAASSSSAMVTEGSPSSSSETTEYQEKIKKIRRILMEGLDIDLTLNFLFKQSHADLQVLQEIKVAIEGRSSVLHNALVVSHSFMNACTTRDSFLRDNLDWLSKAKNWAKFTTVGSIGVVHKGHIHESMNLLRPYLPQPGQTSSFPYSESGALYALGLIHANKGGSGDSATIRYLSEALRNCGNDEVVQHGACLGIGLAAMATGDEELFESLRTVVFTDSAVAGEGAALAIGLLMLGQADSPLAQEVLPQLLNYLHDTAHEKIIRALSLSIAMMVYGKEEGADTIIEQLSRDRDPIVRYGAMYAIALAYCGTADNASIRKLLHVAVSDVNDDVRRAAVTCIGFLMFRQPENVPKLVFLLAESFNPHVRYGACFAIGIACAGTALKEAIDLLTPMLEDSVDFVRQGAVISMAMVLQQTSDARSPSVKKFREHLMASVLDKHQSPLAKSGAIIATGILGAGGGNVVISMQSRAGFMKTGGAVGIMMFMQHWYWHPLMHFLSLSFSSTLLIGLNKDFDVPVDFEVTCNAPPSMFAYPVIEEKKEEKNKMVATAVLSTTAKAKARVARKEAKKTKEEGGKTGLVGGSMSVDGEDPLSVGDLALSAPISLERVTSHLSTTSYLSMEAEKPLTDSPVKPKKVKEPSSFALSNPSRLTPSQARFISLQEGQRYIPVRDAVLPSGIVMLLDTDPSLPENVVKVARLTLGGEDEIAAPPEPFEWNPLNP